MTKILKVTLQKLKIAVNWHENGIVAKLSHIQLNLIKLKEKRKRKKKRKKNCSNRGSNPGRAT